MGCKITIVREHWPMMICFDGSEVAADFGGVVISSKLELVPMTSHASLSTYL
jgi:hypothetical protein